MKPIRSYDVTERILIVLILVLELVIIFKAMMMSFGLGMIFWILFQAMDFLINYIHKTYFGK